LLICFNNSSMKSHRLSRAPRSSMTDLETRFCQHASEPFTKTNSRSCRSTSVRQWLELVADISARDLVDLIAVIEKARADGPQGHRKP